MHVPADMQTHPKLCLVAIHTNRWFALGKVFISSTSLCWLLSFIKASFFFTTTSNMKDTNTCGTMGMDWIRSHLKQGEVFLDISHRWTGKHKLRREPAVNSAWLVFFFFFLRREAPHLQGVRANIRKSLIKPGKCENQWEIISAYRDSANWTFFWEVWQIPV